MDNDNRIIKRLKDTVKTAKLYVSFAGEKIYGPEQGNDLLRKAIQEGTPFLATRFGAVESRCVSKWLKKERYTDYNYQSIKEAAGVFPNTDEMINKFCAEYTDAAKQADYLAVWGVCDEAKIRNKYCHSASLIRLTSLEPFLWSNPWSELLAGKKVLVVHPFTETIRMQLTEHRKHLFRDSRVLPTFKSISYVKAVQSNGGGYCEQYQSWFDALNAMKTEIAAADFDIAIIGAGAYGLPLGAYCKELGKQAIHMAGATQLLFGIRGKRWDSREQYQKFYNEYWVRPSEAETPVGKEKIEGGTYW